MFRNDGATSISDWNGTKGVPFETKWNGTERNDLFLALVPVFIKERDGTSSILNHGTGTELVPEF